jgi:hypothetical protein
MNAPYYPKSAFEEGLGAGCSILFWIGVFIGLFFLAMWAAKHKPGPYYYGHCDYCGQSWKVSSLNFHPPCDGFCDKCQNGRVYFPDMGTQEWRNEKKRFGDE